jgi:Rieske Fe-S protein
VRVDWHGAPVEVRLTLAGPAARSLLCTHFGCPLGWDQARQRYVCPCHGGEFDDDGQPVAGPPNHPLAAVPVRVVGREAVVGLT